MVVSAILMVNYLSDLERPEETFAVLRPSRYARYLTDKITSLRVRRWRSSNLDDSATLP